MIGKLWSAVVILLGFMLAFGGCQTGQKSLINVKGGGPPLSEATLPNYFVGEYFTFDDGTFEIVTEVSGEMVTWRTNQDTISKGYRNFVIPVLSWTSNNRRSEAKTTASADLLWPLAVGKKAQYDFQQTISRHDGTESSELSRTWTCTVEGTERVSVPAGTFDTYVVTCKRYSSSGRAWRATRKFYYAPDLGHYVIREDDYRRSADKKRQMVSYGFSSTVLPQKDQITLNRKLQTALDKNVDGNASTWTNRKGDITVMLIPVRSFIGANGEKCREYHSVYSVKGRIRKNFREVCRQPNGRWQRID